MKFEDEFEVDLIKDKISYIKNSNSKNLLSSSEKFYYDMWISHSHGKAINFPTGQFYLLNDKNKFSFFIKNIGLLKA